MTGIDLVAEAKRIQAEYGYTDERFAVEVLGITKGYWSKLRSGRAKGHGGTFTRAVLGRFPHLALSLRLNVPVDTDKRERRTLAA